ncbi:hypothetical protein GGH13_004209 [Coemansia sp. S155-1]|nr:hypothetical protein GGH13_004209 [Coemansia sp. S155-1]
MECAIVALAAHSQITHPRHADPEYARPLTRLLRLPCPALLNEPLTKMTTTAESRSPTPLQVGLADLPCLLAKDIALGHLAQALVNTK